MTTNLITLLACLSLIESNDDDSKIGDHGKSRGRYQIQEATWNSVEPHLWWQTYAHDKIVSFSTARLILIKHINRFTAESELGRQPTTREIYLLWNCPAKVMRPSKKALATAIRFENMVKSKEGKK